MSKNRSENASFLLEDEVEQDEFHDPDSVEAEPLILNIMEMHFSVGQIFWTMSSGKKITLFKSGDWIQKSYLDKFLKANKNLEIEAQINEDYCSVGLALFKSFMEATEEADKASIRESLIEWLSKGYWNSEEEVGMLDIAFVCSQTFYSFSEEEEDILFETSTELFKRSSVVGSMLVCLGIVVGYLDSALLRDLYHISFLFDCSLDEVTLSTNLISALENERNNGSEWEEALSPSEKETFLGHSQKSVLRAEIFFKKRISSPGLLHFIETHHEKVNGKGFPLGLREGEISDIEGLIIFVNNRLPYHGLSFEKGDASALFRKLMEKGAQLETVLTKRLKKIITNEFENRDSDHAKYLEISGV
jgi:hypothetical protein